MSLTSLIVAGYVRRHVVSIAHLGPLIADVYTALLSTTHPAADEIAEETPAVPVQQSQKPDSLVCLECGKSFKSLKRHLSRHHSLAPQAYREKWKLPETYPMVCLQYAKVRSRLAIESRFGQHIARGKS